MALTHGDFVPSFVIPSSVSQQFHFDTVAGYRICLVFLGGPHDPRAVPVLERLVDLNPLFKRHRVLCFAVVAGTSGQASHLVERFRDAFTLFWDTDGTVHAKYGLASPSRLSRAERLPPGPSGSGTGAQFSPDWAPTIFVLRENLRLQRVVRAEPLDTLAATLTEEIERLPASSAPGLAGRQAPVLFIPDVFDRDLCQELIAAYGSIGGGASGFMRDVQGRTTGVLDPSLKRRKDAEIQDRALRDRINRLLGTRVRPEIRKAFAFEASRIERYLVGCYEASDRGFFSAHRDNTSKATAHRRFAVSINLNTEEFEGGDLAFPEYGPWSYRPATGEAVVFSCALLHAAQPVTAGVRYAFLPFLYDEQAAGVRRENAGFLDRGPAIDLRASA